MRIDVLLLPAPAGPRCNGSSGWKLRNADTRCGNGRHQAAGVLQNGVQTVFDVVALLCCAVLVLGTWRFVSCSLWSWGCLSMSVFIPHWKRSSSLFSAPSAKRNRKCSNSLLKLSSYSDLDYQSMVRCFAHYLVSAVFDLAAVCNFVLLLTIWHLRIRVSLMFDKKYNVAWVHVEGLNPSLWKNWLRSNCKIRSLKSLCMKVSWLS